MAHILLALTCPDDVLASLRTSLATSGHMAVTTHDGAEARGLMATCLFDCAVLDTRVPAHGAELFERGRRTPRTAPLPIALVARNEHERISLLGRVGDDVRVMLTHPVSAGDILDALQLHFGVAAAPPLVRRRTPALLQRPEAGAQAS